MIHYRDMTFCVNPNCTCGPERKYTPEIQAAADKWFGEGPGEGPVCTGDMCKGKPKTVMDALKDAVAKTPGSRNQAMFRMPNTRETLGSPAYDMFVCQACEVERVGVPGLCGKCVGAKEP